MCHVAQMITQLSRIRNVCVVVLGLSSGCSVEPQAPDGSGALAESREKFVGPSQAETFDVLHAVAGVATVVFGGIGRFFARSWNREEPLPAHEAVSRSEGFHANFAETFPASWVLGRYGLDKVPEDPRECCMRAEKLLPESSSFARGSASVLSITAVAKECPDAITLIEAACLAYQSIVNSTPGQAPINCDLGKPTPHSSGTYRKVEPLSHCSDAKPISVRLITTFSQSTYGGRYQMSAVSTPL